MPWQPFVPQSVLETFPSDVHVVAIFPSQQLVCPDGQGQLEVVVVVVDVLQ